jgi:uncharacterized protein (DUF2141 family)
MADKLINALVGVIPLFVVLPLVTGLFGGKAVRIDIVTTSTTGTSFTKVLSGLFKGKFNATLVAQVNNGGNAPVNISLQVGSNNYGIIDVAPVGLSTFAFKYFDLDASALNNAALTLTASASVTINYAYIIIVPVNW